MKDAHFAEQEHACPRTLPLADLRPEGYKQRLYVGPADRAVDRAGEDQFQRGSVTLFLECPVPFSGTVFKFDFDPVVGRSGIRASSSSSRSSRSYPAGLPGRGRIIGL